MAELRLTEVAAASIETPATNRFAIFFNSSNHALSYMDAAASVHTLNAGTALPSTITLGDLFSVSGGAVVTVTGNVTTTKKFLTQTGTGTGSALPAWGTVTESDLPVPAFTTLANATAITWNVAGVRDASAIVTLTNAASTLTISNAANGVAGILKAIQGTGANGLTLPSGSIQAGGGGTTAAISTATGAVDVLAFVYDGSAYIWNIAKAYA